METQEKKVSYQKVVFNETEIVSLGRILRDNKFESRGNDLIYNNSPLDKLKDFIKCYRYLTNISNSAHLSKVETKLDNKEEDEDNKELNIQVDPVDKIALVEKINTYLKNIEPMNAEANDLLYKYTYAINFNKHRIFNKIIAFVNINSKIISDIVDIVNPLGKVIKMYNPDESAGYF